MSANPVDGPLTAYAKWVWESMPWPETWDLGQLDLAILRENGYETPAQHKAVWVTAVETSNAKKRQKDLSGPACPKCGKSMLVRKGKFGRFWGCESFPACRGSRKL